MQKSFIRQEGNLYIPGSEDLIVRTNEFLRAVKDGIFDFTFIIMDTHFPEEYSRTEESKMFPIHCEYGTDDWELAIDVCDLPNRYYLTKNQFNMWSERRLPDIPFQDMKRKSAYDNLFSFVDDIIEPTMVVTRDEFITGISPGNDTANIDVVLIGVASDYCNYYSMEGWLQGGASVTIIDDLTKGIAKETPQIIREYHVKNQISSGLRSLSSSDFLQEERNS